MKNREEWICEQLDRTDLTEETRAKYERELDAIASKYDAFVAKKKAAQEREAARIADIKAKILANDLDFIASFGAEEFGSDYELTTEGVNFVVYSKVASDHQAHRRVHTTLEKAEADLRYLYYNRLYDRYIRGGEIDNLKELVK